MKTTINPYGDTLIQAGAGHGADIASQRADDLDNKAIAFVAELSSLGARAASLDLGASRGAQAKRLLDAGSTIAVACDLFDFSKEFSQHTQDSRGRKHFIQLDLREDDFSQKIFEASETSSFDVIVFQRTIHYFPHAEALIILCRIVDMLSKNGRLYISASGLLSELATGYPHAKTPLSERYCELSELMQKKHGILGPVCLYNQNDLAKLCSDAGLDVIEAQESSFGNIKIVAEKK